MLKAVSGLFHLTLRVLLVNIELYNVGSTFVYGLKIVSSEVEIKTYRPCAVNVSTIGKINFVADIIFSISCSQQY